MSTASTKVMSPPKATAVKVNFESAFLDPDEGKSWAAILTVNSAGKVTRDFIDIDKIWRNFGDEGKKYKMTFVGEFPVGALLEIAQASSKENNFWGRNYMVVTKGGHLAALGNVKNASAMAEAAHALGVPKLEWAF